MVSPACAGIDLTVEHYEQDAHVGYFKFHLPNGGPAILLGYDEATEQYVKSFISELESAKTFVEQEEVLAKYRMGMNAYSDGKYADVNRRLGMIYEGVMYDIKDTIMGMLPKYKQDVYDDVWAGDIVPGPRGVTYKQEAKKAINWLNSHLTPKVLPDLPIAKRIAAAKDKRSWYSPGSRTIYWNGRASVLLHEYAHHLHHLNRSIQQAVAGFFQSRTRGLKKTTIYAGRDEYGYRDQFFDHYVGRVYISGLDGEEVFSMGLEAMYVNPPWFAAHDREHFLLILAIMRGLLP